MRFIGLYNLETTVCLEWSDLRSGRFFDFKFPLYPYMEQGVSAQLNLLKMHPEIFKFNDELSEWFETQDLPHPHFNWLAIAEPSVPEVRFEVRFKLANADAMLFKLTWG